MPPTPSSQNPKPVSEIWQPDLTRLPPMTLGRRLFRWAARLVCRAVVSVCTRATVRGMENYPLREAALVTINHLGDPDAVLAIAFLPEFPEVIVKIELRAIPVLRLLLDAIGVIWVHRGLADRRAISAGLEALGQGRRVMIAPEGRESVSGALEAGTDGAAYLALKAGVPVLPMTITGSEFRRIENSLAKFRRPPISLTVGEPFRLPEQPDRRLAIQEGTRLIMEALARQLPPEYRGVYSYIT